MMADTSGSHFELILSHHNRVPICFIGYPLVSLKFLSGDTSVPYLIPKKQQQDLVSL